MLPLITRGRFRRRDILCGFCLVCAAVAVGLAAPQSMQRARGVLYSDQGGASASATGEVVLHTETGLLRISFARPVEESGFDSGSCRRLGAIWDVIYRIVNGKKLLVKAACLGEVPNVRDADQAVREFFKAVADGDFTTAEKMCTPRSGAVRELRRYSIEAGRTPLSRSVGSTEVIRSQRRGVVLYAYLDRLVNTLQPEICCRVELTNENGRWRIRALAGGRPPY